MVNRVHRIAALLLVFLLCIASFFTVYIRNTYALSEAAVYTILWAIMQALGITVSFMDVKELSWNNIKSSLGEFFDKFEAKLTLTGLTSFLFLFSPAYWLDKVQVDASGNVETADISNDDINAFARAYDAVYGDDGSATTSGETPSLNIAGNDYEEIEYRGYYYNQADLVTSTKTFTWSNAWAYDSAGDPSSIVTGKSFIISTKYLVYDVPILCGTDTVPRTDLSIFCPVISSSNQYFPYTGSSDVYYYYYLLVTGSAAYNALLGGASPTDMTSLDGYINRTSGWSYGGPNTYVYDTVSGAAIWNHSLSTQYPIYNGVNLWSEKHIYFPSVKSTDIYNTNGCAGLGIYSLATENHTVSTGTTVNVAVNTDTSRLESVIAGWNTAVSEGLVASTDTIALTIADNMTELETSITYGLEGMIAQTNANTAAICDSITAASAAAAANTAVGELDLSRLTIPQLIASKFPFCIPFDLYNAFAGLGGYGRQAPVWTLEWSVRGTTAQIDVDFSRFESLALIVRWGFLVAFNIGLILVTRKIIKG